MTTYIESFDKIILGRNAPAILSVERDGVDETIIASFHNFKNYYMENTRAELREKENEFALFLFQFSDSKLPDWWKDSKLIWSTEQENKIKEREENWHRVFSIIDAGELTGEDFDLALKNLAKKHNLK
jgi:hypothetical protein